MQSTSTVDKIVLQSDLFWQRAADFGLEPADGIPDSADFDALSEAFVAVVKDELLQREGYGLGGLYSAKQKLMTCYERFAEAGKIDVSRAFNFYREDVTRLHDLAQTITKKSEPANPRP